MTTTKLHKLEKQVRRARGFARQIMALETEMNTRAVNPDDPGDPERWGQAWGRLVEQTRKFIQDTETRP